MTPVASNSGVETPSDPILRASAVLVGTASRIRKWFIAAPVTAIALAFICTVLAVGGIRSAIRYSDILEWKDANTRTVARLVGILDAANMLSELSDHPGRWTVTSAGDRVMIGKGDMVLSALNARIARYSDGTSAADVTYALSDRDGAPVATAEIRNATRYTCNMLGLHALSGFARRRLEIGIPEPGGGTVSWASTYSDRPTISRACSAFPETIEGPSDKGTVFLRAAAPG